jgi:L(+)-tartrate dehydratase beta subunit
MAHHDLTTPITEAQARALRIDDSVILNGPLFGIRDATQIAMFDRGRATRFDLAGHAVIHTAPNVKKVEVSPAHPAGYVPLCIGTTTSSDERFTVRCSLERARHRQRRLGAASLAASATGGAYRASAAPRHWRRPGSEAMRTST